MNRNDDKSDITCIDGCFKGVGCYGITINVAAEDLKMDKANYAIESLKTDRRHKQLVEDQLNLTFLLLYMSL